MGAATATLPDSDDAGATSGVEPTGNAIVTASSSISRTPATGRAAATTRVATQWRSTYRRIVVGTDLLAAGAASVAGSALRFGDTAAPAVNLWFALALPVVFCLCAVQNRAYEQRFLGAGNIEFERLGRAFLLTVAVVTFTSYASAAHVSRGFVLCALPLTLAFSVLGRLATRAVMHRSQRRVLGSVLTIGSAAEVISLSETVAAQPRLGLRVDACCLTAPAGENDRAALGELGVAVIGGVLDLPYALERVDPHTVAVTSRGVAGEQLRWISWQLEASQADLVVVADLAAVAGRRLHLQEVGGLPLLYVAQPEFTGVRRVVKSLFDRLVAALALVLLTPVILAVAAAIKLTSRGPVFFAQRRIGKNGEPFRMIKFRSMVPGADLMITDLHADNEFAGGTLFKIRQDPRITRVGKILRRFSLDELPQLFNVLTGSMSLVGPRPPLPREVAEYESAASRRLLVKPGMTGLWQISGRSDLNWQQSMELDLRYVESWSLGLDVLVLLKTVRAVVSGRGAY